MHLAIRFGSATDDQLYITFTMEALYYIAFSGIPRRTSKETEFADFSIFEDPEGHYSTFNFKYARKPFDRLAELNKFNTLLAEKTIMDVMANRVRNRRTGKTKNVSTN